MQKIFTESAPKAVGPYSQGISIGNLVFVSGQTPIQPATGALAEGGVEAQAEQACKNVQAVLEAAGSGLDRVVKTTCFILDMESKFLCREDCKGLCPVCGRNLNLGSCDCGKKIDPRFAVLEQLLDK